MPCFGGIAGGELAARRGARGRHVASRHPAVGAARLLPHGTRLLPRSHGFFLQAVIRELTPHHPHDRADKVSEFISGADVQGCGTGGSSPSQFRGARGFRHTAPAPLQTASKIPAWSLTWPLQICHPKKRDKPAMEAREPGWGCQPQCRRQSAGLRYHVSSCPFVRSFQTLRRLQIPPPR